MNSKVKRLLQPSVLISLLLLGGCERDAVVTATMTWDCIAPLSNAPAGVQQVRFFFNETPNVFVDASKINLCDELVASKAKTAQMSFYVWGTKSCLRSFTITRLNGKPFVGPGYSVAMGSFGEDGGQDPLARALRNQP